MTSDTMTEPPGMADANALLMRQLSERAGHDPVAGLLLARLQSAEATGEPDALTVLERRFDAALRANQKLREALVAANEMTAWVAQLTGACSQCWGIAPGCANCAGRGGPGYDLPEVDDLVDWIAPALRRAGLRVTRSEAVGPRRHLDNHHITEQERS